MTSNKTQEEQPATEVISSPRLHELLESEEIEELYRIFKSVYSQKFTPDDLKKIFANFDIHFTDEEYKTLFLKLNTNRDNHCDWDELISHLLLGFQNDDPYGQKEALSLPIEGSPVVQKAVHRYPIVSIAFCPTVMPVKSLIKLFDRVLYDTAPHLQDRSINNVRGNYITTGKDGTINYWTQDLELVKTAKSTNVNLNVTKTCILDCICLPDVRVICTSSIERDLRFYDTSANNFQLRLVISTIPWAITAMYYWFGETVAVNCKIILGDFVGNVIMLEFNPELRGPFQSKPGTPMVQVTWRELLKGKLPSIRVTELGQIHEDIVRQVYYNATINAIGTCAECRDIPVGLTPAAGLVLTDLGIQKNQIVMRMTKGVTCFAYDVETNIFATGGPDCILRLWRHILPKKPLAILPGHHSGIISIFIQDNGQKCYSIDRNKFVKVWDIVEQSLIQTYILLGPQLTDQCPIRVFYNDNTRELLLAGMRMATVKCCPLLKLDKTDGYTHSRQVSVVLYNELFRTIVTCGFDSCIIVWDPWTGKRKTLIKEAHTRTVHGEIVRVEITAACFDPKQQLLLSGARDGTLKVWNFNNGLCIRNLSIEFMCEVTGVFWLFERILAVGWNKHVIEFTDTVEDELVSDGKVWDTCHTEDVLASAAREPQTLATGSYNGELVLWKLETGQPYRRYNVQNPSVRMKITYDGQKVSLQAESKYSRSKSKHLKFLRKLYRSKSRDTNLSQESMMNKRQFHSKSVLDLTRNIRQISIIQMPAQSGITAFMAIHSIIFLQTRPMATATGTLLVSLESGVIQVFSHHNLGGYLDSFNAIHMAGDCVVAMTTDRANRYLFTGTALGYVKTWLIVNFGIPKSQFVRINMPELRLEFPFLIKDRWEGRAKRTVRHIVNPKLLNSYKAHASPITGLIYLNEAKLLVTSSSDYSVRIWTLSGQYIGTLGSPIKWSPLSRTIIAENFNFRIPPDIQRVASSTTLKVLKGGSIPDPLTHIIWLKRQRQMQLDAKNETIDTDSSSVYGQSLVEPILGRHFRFPAGELPKSTPKLDKDYDICRCIIY